MALQSGWILAAHLGKHEHWDSGARAAAGQAYGFAWRNQFATRIRLAAILSSVAASSNGAKLLQAFIGRFPVGLSLGAALSGKTKPVPALG